MLTTLVGIYSSAIPLVLRNAASPIAETPSGTTALCPPRMSVFVVLSMRCPFSARNAVFPSATVIEKEEYVLLLLQHHLLRASRLLPQTPPSSPFLFLFLTKQKNGAKAPFFCLVRTKGLESFVCTKFGQKRAFFKKKPAFPPYKLKFAPNLPPT